MGGSIDRNSEKKGDINRKYHARGGADEIWERRHRLRDY